MNGKSIGCLTRCILLGALAMAGGIYLMNRWDALSGPGRAGGVVLVVLAALLFLPPRHLYRPADHREDPHGQGGERVRDRGRADDAVQQVDVRRRSRTSRRRGEGFRRTRSQLLRPATALLSGQGFRQLGDVVDSTIESFTGMASPIRILSSPDGSTLAAVLMRAGRCGRGLRQATPHRRCSSANWRPIQRRLVPAHFDRRPGRARIDIPEDPAAVSPRRYAAAPATAAARKREAEADWPPRRG